MAYAEETWKNCLKTTDIFERKMRKLSHVPRMIQKADDLGQEAEKKVKRNLVTKSNSFREKNKEKKNAS